MQFLDIYPNLMVLGMYLLDCPFNEIKTSTKSQWKHCPTTPKQNLTLRWRLSSKVQTQLFDQHFPGVPWNAAPTQGQYNQLPFHRGCSNCFVNRGYVLSMYGLIYLFSKYKHDVYWQMFSHVPCFIVKSTCWRRNTLWRWLSLNINTWTTDLPPPHDRPQDARRNQPKLLPTRSTKLIGNISQHHRGVRPRKRP